MGISTIHGGRIDTGSGDGSINNDVDYRNHLNSTYLQRLNSAYNLLAEKCNYNPNIVPFILTTDQHRRYGEDQLKGVYRWIADKVDFQLVTKVINLGDMTDDGNNAQLDTSLDCFKLLPRENMINVWGNHDYGNNASTDQAWVRKYFPNPYHAKYMQGTAGCFSVTDDIYNVKYIVMNNWEHVYDNVHYHGSCSTEQYDWVIKELTKNDGYDVVIMAHDAWTSIDVTWLDDDDGIKGWVEHYSQNTSAEFNWETNLNAHNGWMQCLADRKAKRNGSFTDCLGHVHQYDFRNCEQDVLISLHGHRHTDYYKQLPVTMVEFDCYKTGMFVYFGWVDKKNKKFGWWKVGSGLNTQTLEIDIN